MAPIDLREKPVVYFVDEDIGSFTAYPIALRMRGFEVVTIPDATTALNDLPSATSLDVAVIDVMLAAGADPSRRFDDATTNRGLETGLVLLRYLEEAAPHLFPKRAVLFSAATNPHLVAEAKRVSSDADVPFWQKGRFSATNEFCKSVESRMAALGTSKAE